MTVSTQPRQAREGGFAYIAAVILLVVIAGMVSSVMVLTTTQTSSATEAVMSAQASQAARAGLEWAFYQLHSQNVAACTSTTLTDFQADTGFIVAISCSYTTYNEGQNPVNGSALAKNLFRVEAVACNGSAASCPDNAGSAQAAYTERRRVATICMTSAADDCY